jgi:hypothetical protein
LTTTFVQIISISPGTHAFIGTFSSFKLQVTHDLRQFNLNCILVPMNLDPSLSELKYMITAINNKTHIECQTMRKDLKPGSYWVTLGLKESDNYLDFGKSSI